MAHLVIVEGNLPEHELAVQRALGATPAQRTADIFAEMDTSLTFSFANPWFSDHDPAALNLSAADGMAVIGGVMPWSAADDRAAPLRQMFERAFAASLPCFASGWAMQAAVCLLGGTVGPGSAGPELGIARALRPADHPMTKGRRESFDALSLHAEDVLSAPAKAFITAANDHSAVQALSIDDGSIRFTGTQYHPEMTLADVAVRLGIKGRAASRANRNTARDFLAVAADPASQPRLCAKHRINLDILDQTYRTTELRNWLTHAVKAAPQ